MSKKSYKTKQKIKKYIEILADNISVEKVIIFGSRVRKNYTEESDIDLAIISSDFKKHNYLENIQFLFNKASEIDEIIEAIPYTPEECRNVDPRSFLGEILRTGKTIYTKK